MATAGQTDFPADFPLLKAAGVVARIERDGEALDLRGSSVTAVNPSETGFTCRLAEPASAGDRIWIYSELPRLRDRRHTPHGVVRTMTLEDDAVEAQAQHQEVQRDLNRALLFPIGERPVELPLSDRRRETVPVFDGNGDLIVMPVVRVLNEIGVTFVDDGAWGTGSDPLTYDDGAFA
ncbi:hypothetical protein [Brevundimonas vancanneytii]|uniref:hypothetical protein n=1 Tax=Brevundimonas vancanneytii TaxID=1325724 RepID=UPI0010FE15B2|nr:hypothetical protein [Brevundimonas vancanneytii]